jgi:hypothetical protein
MVVVDIEDTDGQSPREGSKGSKRKSKREVSNYKSLASMSPNIFYSSRVPNQAMTMLSWSMQSRRAEGQTLYLVPTTSLSSINLRNDA